MITLHTLGARGEFFSKLHIGEKLRVIATAEPSYAGSNDLDVPTIEAEVVEQRPDDHQGDVQFPCDGAVGGKIVTLFYSDGESLCTAMPDHTLRYIGVAPIQE